MIDTKFENIIRKIVDEKGKSFFLEPKKFKSFLLDYTRNDFKKEIDLLSTMLEANCIKYIIVAKNLTQCKQFLVKHLEDEYNLSPAKSSEMLDVLFFILRGENVPVVFTRISEQEKISNTEQIIPVIIPKMFTNKVLNDKLAELNKTIIKNKHELDELPNIISNYKNKASQELEERKKYYDECVANLQKIWGSDTFYHIQRYISSDLIYKGYAESALNYSKYAQEKQEEFNEKNRLKLKNELEKSDIEALLRKTEKERTEDYYQMLLNTKNAISDEKDFTDLAEKFRKMEGYRDSKALAIECDNASTKAQYNRLIRAKNAVSTEYEFQDLAKQFRGMNSYENTAELAKECDEQCRILKEYREEQARSERYEQLVQEMNKASTEDKYQDLAKQFRAMNGYKNTTELARKCDEQCRILKEHIEEQARSKRYEQLVQEMNKASTEDKCQDLAKQFRAMNGYKNTTKLARKCDNRCQMLKKQEKMQKKWAFFGLFLQIGVIIGFFYMLLGTDVIHFPTAKEKWSLAQLFMYLVFFSGISFVIGIIDRLFCKGNEGWGSIVLSLLVLATSITLNIAIESDDGIIGRIGSFIGFIFILSVFAFLGFIVTVEEERRKKIIAELKNS